VDQRTTAIVIAAVVILVIVVVALLYRRKRRSGMLRQRFGPEYERVVRDKGDVRKAEGVLEMRARKREELKIVPLSAAVRSDFSKRWMQVQSRFVDDPKGAVADADQLVTEIMHARGYPMADFDHQAEIISVDHPVVVQNYRAAHEIAVRHGRGESSTEDLRKAMVHYRSLFDELLEDSIPQRKEARG
jgi:FtsZ-interacting cell division protein ZipA